jgi:ubiquinone/menaquinone biosynthesis C-methylase UbiE
MAKFEPFKNNALKYDAWFEKNKQFYELELQAIKELLPEGNGIEVGVGSGRFAAPLGIGLGLDPSKEMGKIAEKRGIEFIEGVAESLPFPDSHFDFILMVTTICFLDDIKNAFKEAYRVLKPNGCIIIGFIDVLSPMGREYEKHRNESTFYKDATFYSVEEVISFLRNVHFKNFSFRQTLFQPLKKYRKQVQKGYGEGSFIVIKGTKN